MTSPSEQKFNWSRTFSNFKYKQPGFTRLKVYALCVKHSTVSASFKTLDIFLPSPADWNSDVGAERQIQLTPLPLISSLRRTRWPPDCVTWANSPDDWTRPQQGVTCQTPHRRTSDSTNLRWHRSIRIGQSPSGITFWFFLLPSGFYKYLILQLQYLHKMWGLEPPLHVPYASSQTRAENEPIVSESAGRRGFQGACFAVTAASTQSTAEVASWKRWRLRWR